LVVEDESHQSHENIFSSFLFSSFLKKMSSSSTDSTDRKELEVFLQTEQIKQRFQQQVQ
jgi:hypothetical protein